MSAFKLTGNIRLHAVRVGAICPRQLLVLQVEETGIETAWLGGEIESDTVTRWRDARVDDLAVAEGLVT